MKTDENSGSIRPFGFRSPRVCANFGFYLEVIATGERCDGVCTDISEDGLAAELSRPLTPKTQVTMRLLFPGGTVPLQIQGSVEYSQDLRCGVNFLYSSQDERKQIQKFIQSVS